ncbi:hypothetical protein PoHVEF18_008866 [Penicillium ochrochloron]
MTPVVNKSAIPGTVTLVDVEHVLHTRHLSSGNGDIVLIPTPSHDPDDPLNWSRKRKLLSTVCVSVYTLFAGIACSVVYSVLTPLSKETGLSVSTLNEGTGPYANTQGQWIARNVISGFFTAPIEALPEISVTDVYFTHERGTYMGFYAFFLAGSNYFAPVICGFIAEYQGWRWVFYWPSIFVGCAMIFLFFFMEETNYVREHVDDTIANVRLSSSNSSQSGDPEKAVPVSDPPSQTEEGTIYTKKSYIQKLALLGPRQKQNTMFRRLWQTIYYLSWPVIFYAGFSYGSYLVLFNILNGTASIILGSAPYNFGYVACCLGVAIGSIFTGRFSDWLTIKLARRNGGVMEAEHRLWPFLACLILVPGSLLLWGVGAAHEVHWFGLIVAMCMLAFTNTCGITLSVNYLVDSYRELSGVAMASVILVRNTMSFAIGYG